MGSRSQPSFEEVDEQGRKICFVDVRDPITGTLVDAVVHESNWTTHLVSHRNIAANWAEVLETLARPDTIHESLSRPEDRWVYFKDWPVLLRDDGTNGRGTLMVVVDRTLEPYVYVTAFIPEDPDRKKGRLLWP